MAEMDMREVVQRLRAENSEALLELLEFDSALDEFILFLERLAAAAQEPRDAARGVGAVQERFETLAEGTAQALNAFRVLRQATKAWEIVAVDKRPTSGGSSSAE